MRKHARRTTLRFKESKKPVTIYYKEYKILIFDADTFFLGIVYSKDDGKALFNSKAVSEIVATEDCFKFIRNANNKRISREDSG